jgi:hypothetical protein
MFIKDIFDALTQKLQQIKFVSEEEENDFFNFVIKKIYEDYIQILNCIFGEETNDIAIMLEEIFDNNEPYLISHLAIDGNLLIEKGYKGFEIGKILNELLNLVIENPTLNTKENLITNLNQHHRL